MQTQLLASVLNTPEGQLADSILRKCVHCGFCNATCPTYQILGDENEGPRGRIYLIKQLLEGKAASQATLAHLDHCLICRSCETTCPSGVEYGKLLDIGRYQAAQQIERPSKVKQQRRLLGLILPHPRLVKWGVSLARYVQTYLPAPLQRKLPAPVFIPPVTASPQQRHVLILDGCVQPTLAPDINAVTERVLNRLGIGVIHAANAGCCGAINQHLEQPAPALQLMQRNIDAWWPFIESGQVEAIIATASGCGATLKDYAYYLRNDANYAAKAAKIASFSKDIAELIAAENYQGLNPEPHLKRIAWHPPCSLQHGQKIQGVVEQILKNCGYDLLPVVDSHLCCGSAGTYSILQPALANQLKINKINHLLMEKPELIVTANIGCQLHLQEGTSVPVQHWIHLLDNTKSA
jgi:glycolate oxidase iron-sulfur subunit